MKTVIEMAQECQLIGMRPYLDGIYQKSLERFAELVRADEREAVLDLVDDYAKGNTDLRDAIRARSNT